MSVLLPPFAHSHCDGGDGSGRDAQGHGISKHPPGVDERADEKRSRRADGGRRMVDDAAAQASHLRGETIRDVEGRHSDNPTHGEPEDEHAREKAYLL